MNGHGSGLFIDVQNVFLDHLIFASHNFAHFKVSTSEQIFGSAIINFKGKFLGLFKVELELDSINISRIRMVFNNLSLSFFEFLSIDDLF